MDALSDPLSLDDFVRELRRHHQPAESDEATRTVSDTLRSAPCGPAALAVALSKSAGRDS